MKYAIRFIAGILAAGCLVVAQTKPTFEVASIKPGNPNEVRSGVHIQPGGLFKCENTTVKTLIRFAYDLQNYEIAGGPPWMPSAIFTIEARASSSSPEGFDDQTMKLRIQALLEDRFHLSTHKETRQEPIYELVVAKGGQKMRLASNGATDSNLSVRTGQLIGENAGLSQLVRSLSLQVDRAVVDKTGLAKRYDFTMNYAPEARDGIFGELLPPGTAAAVEPGAPSIFTALQEQLGLRLESARASIPILVIDSAVKPAEN